MGLRRSHATSVARTWRSGWGARLEARGVTIAGRPRVTGDGYYEAVIADPEGNRLELME